VWKWRCVCFLPLRWFIWWKVLQSCCVRPCSIVDTNNLLSVMNRWMVDWIDSSRVRINSTHTLMLCITNYNTGNIYMSALHIMEVLMGTSIGPQGWGLNTYKGGGRDPWVSIPKRAIFCGRICSEPNLRLSSLDTDAGWYRWSSLSWINNLDKFKCLI